MKKLVWKKAGENDVSMHVCTCRSEREGERVREGERERENGGKMTKQRESMSETTKRRKGRSEGLLSAAPIIVGVKSIAIFVRPPGQTRRVGTPTGHLHHELGKDGSSKEKTRRG